MPATGFEDEGLKTPIAGRRRRARQRCPESVPRHPALIGMKKKKKKKTAEAQRKILDSDRLQLTAWTKNIHRLAMAGPNAVLRIVRVERLHEERHTAKPPTAQALDGGRSERPGAIVVMPGNGPTLTPGLALHATLIWGPGLIWGRAARRATVANFWCTDTIHSLTGRGGPRDHACVPRAATSGLREDSLFDIYHSMIRAARLAPLRSLSICAP